MKNLYKRTDIFSCHHDSHRGFKNRISVYHILKEKKCFPQGCFYFRWKCKLLSKQKKCHRGFRQVGRKCFGCRYFYEEKVHNYPELQIDEEQYLNFLEELDKFEDWLEQIQYRDIEISGIVSGIKPHFQKRIYPKAEHLSFKGYILIFKNIFLDRYHMDDYVYGLISSNYYQKIKLGRGTKIEAIARLKTAQGRLILTNFRRIEIIEEGEPPYWNDQQVLIVRETATEFNEQPESCVQCPFGALVDVLYLKNHHSHSRRSLLCLKGNLDYRDCYVRAEYCGLEKDAHEIYSTSCQSGKKTFHL